MTHERNEHRIARRRSWRVRALGLLARAAYERPAWIILAGLLLAVVSVLGTREWLTFKTSRDDLISPKEAYVQIYRAYQREFGDKDDLVIVVEHPELRTSKDFARRLALRLEKDPQAAREVLYRIDPDELQGKALLYLSVEDLHDLDAKLEDHRDVVDAIAADPSLETLLRSINREISAALVGHLVSSFLGTAPEEKEKRALDLTLLETLIRSVGDAVERKPYESIWRSFLRPGNEMDEDGFLVDDNRRLLFVLVVAPEDTSVMASAADAIERVRLHIAAVQEEIPGVRVGITGGPALAAEEMQASVDDTTLASVLALAGIAACFILFYQDIARPLLAVFTLTMGLAWSFGFTTIAVGHLSILTVVFATILIGMSDDFGVHLISRFEEEIGRQQPLRKALRRTFVHSGGGIVSGAVTFAIAFFSMMLTSFLGIAELGLIGGAGVLLCLVAMLTVFPALLVVYERWKAGWLVRWVDAHLRIPSRLAGWRPHVIDRVYRRPAALLAGAAALSVVGLLALPRVGMDFNLLHLQARGTESVEWELRILHEAKRSSQYAVSIATTLQEARRLEAAYEDLPEVGRVESAASLIPENQEERIRAVEELRPAIQSLPEIGAPSEQVDVAEVRDLLQSIRFKLQEDEEDRWDPARKPVEEELRVVRTELARVVPLLDEDSATAALLALQRDVFLDMADQIDFLVRNTRTERIDLDNLPPLLERRFIGATGKFLVQVFPAKNVWERGPLEEFVSALRRIDPRVTGGPVSFYESSLRMRDGYIEAGLYALAAICVLVLVDFRDVRLALLSLAPLGVGALWTVGLMWLIGLQFNLANLIILPLIVGIGISNGIHIIHRHLEDGSHQMSVIARSTGKAVVLSSITTMVGFGSLMVARHQGIFSLGLLLTIGIGCNLLASVTVLPSLLSYLPVPDSVFERERKRAREAA